jgi:hypothetical protein
MLKKIGEGCDLNPETMLIFPIILDFVRGSYVKNSSHDQLENHILCTQDLQSLPRQSCLPQSPVEGTIVINTKSEPAVQGNCDRRTFSSTELLPGAKAAKQCKFVNICHAARIKVLEGYRGSILCLLFRVSFDKLVSNVVGCQKSVSVS